MTIAADQAQGEGGLFAGMPHPFLENGNTCTVNKHQEEGVYIRIQFIISFCAVPFSQGEMTGGRTN